MSLFDSLKRAGLVAADMQYVAGSTRESVANVAATSVATVRWSSGRKQKAIVFAGVGALWYPDSTALRLVGNTQRSWIIVAPGGLRQSAGNQQLIWKGPNYQLYLQVTNFRFDDWTNDRFVSATAFFGARVWVLTHVNGAAAKLYADGTLVGAMGGVSTLASTAGSNLYVGNPDSGTRPNKNPLSRVAIVTKELTSSEVATVSEELLAPSAGSPKCYGWISSPAVTTVAPSLHYLLDRTIPGTNTIPDLSASNIAGTASVVGSSKGLLAPTAIRFQGAAASKIVAANALTTLLASNNTYAVSVWLKPRNLASNPVFFASGTADALALRLMGNTTIRWISGPGFYDATGAQQNEDWTHLVFQKTAATTGIIYQDGQKIATATGLAGMHATPGDLYLGQYSLGTLQYAGDMQDLRIYPAGIDAATVSRLFLAGAKRCTFNLPMRAETEVTLVDVVGDAQIGNTPFRQTAGGTARIVEASMGRKNIQCVGAQYFFARAVSMQAYGTWVFDITPAGGACSVAFVINGTINVAAATRLGYMLECGNVANVRLYLLNGASATEIFKSVIVTPQVRHTFAVTRTSDGVFTIYGRGGNIGGTLMQLVALTGSNPVTETTVTTSKYFGVTSESNNLNPGFGNFHFFEKALTLDQLKAMGV